MALVMATDDRKPGEPPRLIPEHWLGHPVLGAHFAGVVTPSKATTPASKANDKKE